MVSGSNVNLFFKAFVVVLWVYSMHMRLWNMAVDVILFRFQSLGFVLWVDLVHTQLRSDPGACDRIKGSPSSALYSLRFPLYPLLWFPLHVLGPLTAV